MKRRVATVVVALLVMGTTMAPSGLPATHVVSGNQTLPQTTIPAGDIWEFDPNVSTTLTMTGSLIVEGELRMRPANPGVVHRIVFSTANESAFVGTVAAGQPQPYATDQGLWVVGGGMLDLVGATREPWGRATTAVAAGTAPFTLDRDPVGWQVGDQLYLTPTAPGDYFNDAVTVTAISGRTITTTARARSHPSVALPDGTTATTEVLNLTRNVRIEGTPPTQTLPTSPTVNDPGRTHVFIENDDPVIQTIDYVAILHTWPRQFPHPTQPNRSTFVLGRYSLHFHMGANNNVGTRVTGTVVRGTGSHAFVAHMTNGITFDRTIAVQANETAYWWDVKADDEGNLSNHPSNNVRYENTVAAGLSPETTNGNRVAGYSAACGTGNEMVGVVAAAVGGGIQQSGIFWPEGANGCANTWVIDGAVTHNNERLGIFNWQNDGDDPHSFNDDMVAYNNGKACLENGAYTHGFDFARLVCLGGTSSVIQHAVANNTNAGILDDARIGGSSTALRILSHTQAAGTAGTAFRDWVVSHTGPDAVSVEETGTKRGRYDFVCWTLPGGAELEATDFVVSAMRPDSVYRVQQRDGDAYQLLPNGTATPIAAFASCS